MHATMHAKAEMMCVNRMGPGKTEERDSENSASDPEWVATMHACEGSVMMNIRAISIILAIMS